MSETLERVQVLIRRGEVEISRHGFRELAADDILLDEVVAGVNAAVTIEDLSRVRERTVRPRATT
jgi:hypothetical protein